LNVGDVDGNGGIPETELKGSTHYDVEKRVIEDALGHGETRPIGSTSRGIVSLGIETGIGDESPTCRPCPSLSKEIYFRTVTSNGSRAPGTHHN
jgi:hypothetical protein